MPRLRTSLFDNLLIKFALVLTLLTPSGVFELFKEGGAIPQAELLDVKATGLWVYANVLFWPFALVIPLYLLAVRGRTSYLKLWRNGPGLKIVAGVAMLSVLQLAGGTPFYDGSIRVTVSLFLMTLVLSAATGQLSSRDLLRTLNGLYFASFLFSLYLIVLVPSYGVSADHDSSWQGMFFHKNALGTFCATYAAFIFVAWRTGRLLTTLNVLLSAVLIFQSHSYSAIAAYVLSLLLMVVPLKIKKLMLRSKGPIVLTTFVACLFLVVLSISSFKFKILDKDLTFSDRNLVWGYSLLESTRAPVLGHGINSLGHEVAAGNTGLYHATGQMLTSHHNGFIAALYDFGLVGVVVFFLIFSMALKRIRGYGRLQYGYLCCFLTSIVMNTFEERLISFNIFLFVFLLLSYLNEKELADFAATDKAPAPATCTSGPDRVLANA